MDKMETYYLAVFYLLIVPTLCDDWTSTCPTNCTCKWTNGKKSAICNTLELTKIPTKLSTELQVLVLNENHITDLKGEEFTNLGLVNLQRIYLKKSKIKTIDKDSFKNLKILIEIDLSDNEIEVLDRETFSGNDRLRILYLSGNPIRKLLDYQFSHLPHLRTLDLHDCFIKEINPTAFVNLELLEFLNLKNNQLENLSENVFKHMKNLKTLGLDDNPWRCDCKLRDFRNWYLKTSLNRIGLKCEEPKLFKDQTWEAIDDEHIGCGPIIFLFNNSNSNTNVELGDNITYSCFVNGDPQPEINWDLNGKFLDNENILFDIEDTLDGGSWSNLTIFNVTRLDGGVYSCSAKNIIGFNHRNLSLILPELVEQVSTKTPETFWYFGLIIGAFGTIFSLMFVSITICLCRKATRRRVRKNLKGSVSFNDQEKKLLDLSITTTTTHHERQDSLEMVNTPSTHKNESVIALEPVQISIENITSNDEFPLNVGVFPPPPEFCSNVIPTTAYGNIFISVSVTQDALDNPDLNMYPDLLNIPNRVKGGKFVPVNVASYATLPRKNRQNQIKYKQDNIINYHNLDTNYGGQCSKLNLCRACIKNKTQTYIKGEDFMKCEGFFLCPNYDNMGRRVTASGNSTLSLPDEEQIERDIIYEGIKEIPTPPLPPNYQTTGCDFVSL